MQQHAQDMLAALDALQHPFCHLATHSTGGIIAARMLLMQPQRFGRVFALDPVTPLGMSFNADQIGLFRAMMASRELTRAMMATAASSLFVPESLAPNMVPRFREGLGDRRRFSTILEQTFGVSEGIWIGTPFNLKLERESRELDAACRRSASASGAVGREGRLDSAGRSQGHGGRDAGLPADRGAGIGHSMNLRVAGALRRLFRRLVRRTFARIKLFKST